MKNAMMANDLTEGRVTKKLLVFSAPFLLANLLQTFYNLADMIIVGQVVGSTGLSALANGGEILHFISFMGMGFSSAGQILISQYTGAKNSQAAKKCIGTLFTSITILSIVVMIAALVLSDQIISWMKIPEEACSQAKAYCVVCYCGTFFIFGYNAVSSILRGMGDSRHPLYFIAIATALNVLLDLLFVVVWDMGAMGAALATVLGQAISFIVSIAYLYRKREAFGFDFSPRSFIPDHKILTLLIDLGVPLVIQQIAVHFSMLFVTARINTYGLAASAITGVGNKISSMITVVTGSLGVAGAAMIGQNLGAEKPERVHLIIRDIALISIFFGCIMSFFLVCWPVQIFSLWNSDPTMLALVPSYVPVVVINLFGFTLRSPCLALVNGLGHSQMNFATGLLDGVVFRVGLSYLLGVVFDFGVYGFWYGAAIAGTTTFLLVAPYYISGCWKKRKPITQQD